MSIALGTLIQGAADAAGVSQTKLAKLTGMSQPAISQYFNCIRPITVDVLVALCVALELDAPELLAQAIETR